MCTTPNSLSLLCGLIIKISTWTLQKEDEMISDARSYGAYNIGYNFLKKKKKTKLAKSIA